MMDSYMRGCFLGYETKSADQDMTVTSAPTQESISRSDLCNIFYDKLLRMQISKRSQWLETVDDIAVLITDRDVDVAQHKLDQAMRKMDSWFFQ
ncbi:hypothetical protein QE152_g19524 [Popillia japonica]|uniref:Uncharacterized protein n=1 Tax=Popillia japonica TaxID=7064 RepID=A0AAW1KNX1_POPJA